MLIAIAATAILSTCQTDAQATFDALKAKAHLTSPQLNISHDLPHYANARTDITRKATIVNLDAALCEPESNPAHAQAILAHELGHVLAWQNDKFKATFMPGYDAEQEANNYGAKLLDPATQQALLAYLKSECQTEDKADPYWCKREASWTYSINQSNR